MLDLIDALARAEFETIFGTAEASWVDFKTGTTCNALLDHLLEAVLTRAQLAHLAGISRRRIEQIESGIATTTTPDTARALASALGCR